MSNILAVLALIGATLLIVAVIAMRKRNPVDDLAPTPARDPFDEVTGAAEFHPNKLGPGAIIVYGATDYVVRGTLAVQQGPFTWYEYLLDGGDGSSWLGVEVDEGQLELVWWKTRKSALAPQPTLEFEGVTYLEGERGHATYTSIGTTGLPESGQMRYVDFADSTGQQRLGFEGWGNDESWQMSTGRVVLPGELTVYPAPSAS